MSDSISRADAIKAVEDLPNAYNGWSDTYDKACIIGVIEELPSADAEPKWNCTANFVAEQLDRLRKMTDEEKWNFFREFFGMGDAVHGEWIIRENGNKECSLCGHERQDGWDYFCGYCGAIMKGGAE